MILVGVTAPHPVTGQPEQAFKCFACEGVFVGFQMDRKRTYCRKCDSAIMAPNRARKRAKTFAGINDRHIVLGRVVR